MMKINSIEIKFEYKEGDNTPCSFRVSMTTENGNLLSQKGIIDCKDPFTNVNSH